MEKRINNQRERVKRISDDINTMEEYKVLKNRLWYIIIDFGDDGFNLKVEILEQMNDKELKDYLEDEIFLTTPMLYTKWQAKKVIKEHINEFLLSDDRIYLSYDILDEIVSDLTHEFCINYIHSPYYDCSVEVGYYEKKLDSMIYFYQIHYYWCCDMDIDHHYYDSMEDIVTLLMEMQKRYYEVRGEINKIDNFIRIHKHTQELWEKYWTKEKRNWLSARNDKEINWID